MDLSTGQKIGLGVGGGLGALGAGMLFGGGGDRPDYQNPANSAMPYLDQVPNELKQYFNPYIKPGQESIGNLGQQADLLTGRLPGVSDQLGHMTDALNPYQQQLRQMMGDPGSILSRIGGGYQESPGYKFSLTQALNAANQSAAAGGMAGTPMAQQNSADIAQQMASRDYNQYLTHALGLFDSGQSGLGALGTAGLEGQMNLYNKGLGVRSDLSQLGSKAGMGLGENIANSLIGRGNLAYSGTQNQNNLMSSDYARDQQQKAAQWGSLGEIGGAAAMIPFLIP